MKTGASVNQGYDIIGDIHGCAHTLEKLLLKLDYVKNSAGVFEHPSRQAVFVGDIVDRGPNIREALHIVKNMVDCGAAQCVMGNHEYNAIGYTTPAPEVMGRRHLREHNARHNRLIAETLEQFASFPEEWRTFLDWFKTLPVFLELPGFRVIHACWDQYLIDCYKTTYGTNLATDPIILESFTPGSLAWDLFDRALGGTTLDLPAGECIRGRDGYVRTNFRTKFWSNHPEHYRDVVFQPDPLPEHLAQRPLSPEEKLLLVHYPAEAPPVFVGHYWLQGPPRVIRHNVACLDYSAVKFGRLVAYQFDGEQELVNDKFVWVYVDPEN